MFLKSTILFFLMKMFICQNDNDESIDNLEIKKDKNEKNILNYEREPKKKNNTKIIKTDNGCKELTMDLVLFYISDDGKHYYFDPTNDKIFIKSINKSKNKSENKKNKTTIYYQPIEFQKNIYNDIFIKEIQYQLNNFKKNETKQNENQKHEFNKIEYQKIVYDS